jgi:flagellar hook-associated protein 1 FlgK
MTVLLGGGRPLIEGTHANTLVAATDPDDPLRATIQMQDSQGNLVDVSNTLPSGKLAALTEIGDTVLPDLSTDLNRLAAQLSSSVNQVHSTGYGLNGSTGNAFFAPRQVTGQTSAQNAGGGSLQSVHVFDPTQLTLDEYRITFVSGGPPTFDIVNTTTGETLAAGQTYTSGAAMRFDGIEVVVSDSGTAPQQGDSFTFSTIKDAAKHIAVDPGIVTNVKNIAAGTTPQPGDNTNALALADLGSAALIDDITFGEFYNTMVSKIGVDSRSQQDLATHQELVLAEVENQREALAGVSLDEEQIDLIRFQQAYGAAANLIRVADEMTDVVLNMIR